MAKPVHPAFVHFPIAFLFLAYALDILAFNSASLPAALTNVLPPLGDLPRLSYHLLSLGLITSVPAVLSGGQQLVTVVLKQGMYETDGKTLKEKVKASFAHAVTADLAIAASAYIWYTKKTAAQESLLGKVAGEEAALAYSQPSPLIVGAQILLIGLLGFSASIGGALTYNFGVGFSAGRSGGAKKTQ